MPDAPEIYCKSLPIKDLKKAYKLNKQYIEEEESFRQFKKRYKNKKFLFTACYRNETLIGLAHGKIMGDYVILTGIAVLVEFWRKGYGTTLLRFFEEQVKTCHGLGRISVGCAADVRTESFYLKNGYEPVSLLVWDNDWNKMHVECSTYDPGIREKVKKERGAAAVNFVFDKMIDP